MPDEFAETSLFQMARWGRITAVEGIASPEEHARQIDSFIARSPDLKRAQESHRDRLMAIFAETDPINLVAYASLTYLSIDPNTYKEWESDRSPAHVEYLALQALQVDSDTVDPLAPDQVAELANEAIGIVREMFEISSTLTTIEGISAMRENPDDPTIEYSFSARIQSLGVRNLAYTEHTERIVHGCFDKLDAQCLKYLGFTGSNALSLARNMGKIVSERLTSRATKAEEEHDRLIAKLKRERRGRDREARIFPDWLISASWPTAASHISHTMELWLFLDSKSLMLVTPEQLSSASQLDISICQAFLEAYTCPREIFDQRHHAYPGGVHPLTVYPIIQTGDGYILPAFSSFFDAIRPRMEDLLQKYPKVWERYRQVRGEYLESESTSLISNALPGSRSWNGVKWRSSTENSDLDGLVTADDFTVKIQCKAGRLTASARRGAKERMRTDVGKLIESAAKQHEALEIAIADEGARAIGFSSKQAAALEERIQIEAIVCLDDVTVWATETHELRKLGMLTAARQIPWVLSLADLMAVTDLLHGAEFVHYLMRRQRIERDGRIMAHDELDWVGNYIAEGLYFDHFFEGDFDPQFVRLTTYTEMIDSWYFKRDGHRTIHTPKPEQPIPINLKKLIDRLEDRRPKHWILACIALLEGDDEWRLSWDRAIVHIGGRLKKESWSNATQTFKGRMGVTLYVDANLGLRDIHTRVMEYCSSKSEELGLPNWIVIVNDLAKGTIFVDLIESASAPGIVEMLLMPPNQIPVE